MSNWKSLSVIALVGLVAVVGLGLKCGGGYVPPTLTLKSVPPLFQGQRIAFEVMADQPEGKRVKYKLDWGEGQGDTITDTYTVGDAATVYHRWADTGSYEVKAASVNPDDENDISEWSDPVTIELGPNDAPTVVHFKTPPTAAENGIAVFYGAATDPDNDSVRIHVFFGDNKDSASVWVASGETTRVRHMYEKAETVDVYCQAEDIKGAFSEKYPQPPVRLPVIEAGGVRWWWLHDFMGDDEGYPVTAPVIAMNEGVEFVYVGGDDEAGRFFGIRISDGDERERGSVEEPLENHEWSGHPAYNAVTHHIICGKEDGEIYAYDEGLGAANWHWPDANPLTEFSWGTPAVSPNKIYIIREDTLPDQKLFVIPDGVGEPPPNPTFISLGVEQLNWPPVLDNQGNVYYCTDSGYLYKRSGDLAEPPLMKVAVELNSELSGPVFGTGGVMYVTSQSGKIYALDANGTEKWSVGPLYLSGENFVAVSPTHVFVASDNGNVYCFNPANGDPVWKSPDDPTRQGAFIATPVLVSNGYLYAQDDEDVLWCMDQATGEVIWYCECEDPYGRGRVPKDVDEPWPAPTVASTGDVIMVGQNSGALFCVAGYDDGLLMNAPWPKYQYNTGNTGMWGGF